MQIIEGMQDPQCERSFRKLLGFQAPAPHITSSFLCHPPHYMHLIYHQRWYKLVIVGIKAINVRKRPEDRSLFGPPSDEYSQGGCSRKIHW